MSKDDEKAEHPKGTPPPKKQPTINVDVKANLEQAEKLVAQLKELDETIARSHTFYDQVVYDMGKKAEDLQKLREEEVRKVGVLLDYELRDVDKVADSRLRTLTKAQDWIDNHFDGSEIDDINAIEATKYKKVVYSVSVRNSVDAAMSLAAWLLGEMTWTWRKSGPAPSETETYYQGKRIR